jgi:hypothetical protein
MSAVAAACGPRPTADPPSTSAGPVPRPGSDPTSPARPHPACLSPSPRPRPRLRRSPGSPRARPLTRRSQECALRGGRSVRARGAAFGTRNPWAPPGRSPRAIARRVAPRAGAHPHGRARTLIVPPASWTESSSPTGRAGGGERAGGRSAVQQRSKWVEIADEITTGRRRCAQTPLPTQPLPPADSGRAREGAPRLITKGVRRCWSNNGSVGQPPNGPPCRAAPTHLRAA